MSPAEWKEVVMPAFVTRLTLPSSAPAKEILQCDLGSTMTNHIS
jgi:hypothetical protein